MVLPKSWGFFRSRVVLWALVLFAVVASGGCKQRRQRPDSVSLRLVSQVWRFDATLSTPIILAEEQGELLVAATLGGRLLLLRGSGRPPRELLGADGGPLHDGAIRSLALSSSGSRLLSVGGRTAAVWDTYSGALLRELRGPDAIISADMHADGQVAVFGTARGHVMRWMPPSVRAEPFPELDCGGTLVPPVRMGLPRSRRCPDGNYLELEDGRPACLYPVTHLQFLTGNVVARVCRTGEGLVLDLASGTKRYMSPGHLMQLCPWGQELVFARADGLIRLFDPKQRRVVRTFKTDPIPATQLKTHGDLLVAVQGTRLRIWHKTQADPISPPLYLPGQVSWLDFDQRGLRLLLTDGLYLSYRVEPRTKHP